MNFCVMLASASVSITLVLQSAQMNQVAKSEISNHIYKRRGEGHNFLLS